MAKTSRKQALAKAEAQTREIAEAMKILTKPMRTKRIQPTKTLYNLINDDNGEVMGSAREYTKDLAIMCAMRVLTKLKRYGSAPSHATLIIGEGSQMGEVIQGFKRT